MFSCQVTLIDNVLTAFKLVNFSVNSICHNANVIMSQLLMLLCHNANVIMSQLLMLLCHNANVIMSQW